MGRRNNHNENKTSYLWNEIKHIYIRSFFALKTGKEIIGNDRYLKKSKQDSQKFNFLYYYKLSNII